MIVDILEGESINEDVQSTLIPLCYTHTLLIWWTIDQKYSAPLDKSPSMMNISSVSISPGFLATKKSKRQRKYIGDINNITALLRAVGGEESIEEDLT